MTSEPEARAQACSNTGQVRPSRGRCPRCSSRSVGSTADRTEPQQEAPASGLSIVRSITAAHGGTVRAQPRPGGGLTVEIDMPPASSAADR